MTDFDSIWRTQDEIRTVVNAVLGECIWDLSYNERRMGIELELTQYLEEESADALINQFAHLKPPCEVLRPLIDHVEAHAVAVTVRISPVNHLFVMSIVLHLTHTVLRMDGGDVLLDLFRTFLGNMDRIY